MCSFFQAVLIIPNILAKMKKKALFNLPKNPFFDWFPSSRKSNFGYIPDPSLITHIYDIEMNIRISENIDKDVDVDGNKVAEDNAPRKLGCDAMFNGE